MSRFGEICRTVCEQNAWDLGPEGIRMEVPGGRSQLVELEVIGGEPELVRLWTGIGARVALSQAQLVDALHANATLRHGALAVRDDTLGMTDTLVLEDADPGELEAACRYLARTADFFENALFHKDTR